VIATPLKPVAAIVITNITPSIPKVEFFSLLPASAIAILFEL
jgi:hypothetical protein